MNTARKMVITLAIVGAIGLLVAPVFAQNTATATPVPKSTTPTAVPTKIVIITTLKQDEIDTTFTPFFSKQLRNVKVTLGNQQVVVDFEGTGSGNVTEVFQAVAVPQFVEVVGKITWVVNSLTVDGNAATPAQFTTWGRRVHNLLDARMPKRFRGFTVTVVDITPEQLSYTMVQK